MPTPHRLSKRCPWHRWMAFAEIMLMALLPAPAMLLGAAGTAAAAPSSTTAAAQPATTTLVGKSRDEVVALLGKPQSEMHRDGRDVLVFAGGVRVEIAGGRVVSARGGQESVIIAGDGTRYAAGTDGNVRPAGAQEELKVPLASPTAPAPAPAKPAAAAPRTTTAATQTKAAATAASPVVANPQSQMGKQVARAASAASASRANMEEAVAVATPDQPAPVAAAPAPAPASKPAAGAKTAATAAKAAPAGSGTVPAPPAAAPVVRADSTAGPEHSDSPPGLGSTQELKKKIPGMKTTMEEYLSTGKYEPEEPPPPPAWVGVAKFLFDVVVRFGVVVVILHIALKWLGLTHVWPDLLKVGACYLVVRDGVFALGAVGEMSRWIVDELKMADIAGLITLAVALYHFKVVASGLTALKVAVAAKAVTYALMIIIGIAVTFLLIGLR